MRPTTPASRRDAKSFRRSSGVPSVRRWRQTMMPTFLAFEYSNQVAQLGVRPLLPLTFDDLVFESQLAGEARELLDAVEGVLAAVEVPPDRPAGLQPWRADPLRKQLRIRRRGEIRDDVAVDERVEIARDHHDAPGGRDRAVDRGRIRQALRFLIAEPKREGIVGRMPVPEPLAKSPGAVCLQRHAGVAAQIGFGDRSVAARRPAA